MSRRLLCALIVMVALCSVSATAWASNAPAGGSQSESGSPINDQGSSYHYRTYITEITPHVKGLSVEVLEFADRLLLRNDTGKTITIYGYSGEPYARIEPNGTTEQNLHSPAVYLNTNFYANVTVPSSARASAQPEWTVLDRTGQMEWHDHRIHWMSPAKPPEVSDEGKRTKIFDWSVPIAVGSQPGRIEGELYWVPQGSKAPVAAFVALVLIVLLGALTVILARRRRERTPSPGPGKESDRANAKPEREAW